MKVADRTSLPLFGITQSMMDDQIKFCVRCGASLQLVLRAGRERPTCLDCGWVYFPDPKVAVAALALRGGNVLLVRRANRPQQGLWTLPAGFVDAGEDPAQAVIRECLEETSLTVKTTGLLDILVGQEHTKGSHLLIVYQVEILSGVLHPGDDVDRAAFFGLQDLPPLAFASTQEILHRFS